jgi:hypothetical protein
MLLGKAGGDANPVWQNLGSVAPDASASCPGGGFGIAQGGDLGMGPSHGNQRLAQARSAGEAVTDRAAVIVMAMDGAFNRNAAHQ